jgi:predicted MPP superfamily phosphohydrolase
MKQSGANFFSRRWPATTILAAWLTSQSLAPVRAAEPFFFIQLSDPQLGMFTDNTNFVQETANYEFAVATVNRLKPAFVVVTGDLVNRPGDRDQIAEYLRITAKVDRAIPVHNVAGNHDVGNVPTPDAANITTFVISLGDNARIKQAMVAACASGFQIFASAA